MYFLFIFSWWDDGASICSRASDFDCHSSRPVTPSRQGRTKVQFEVSQYVLDVLWCQPFKLMQAVPTSESHEY